MNISQQKPAVYEICIEGSLDPYWSRRLSHITVNPINCVKDGFFTVLSGEIVDQATLFGLLLALYDLKLPLVSVKRLEDA